ncbi:hypothetical protein bcere0019_53680 [Bacillus cereus Rock3-28]|nr:hypothetical protein bcere0019_53680 [Bacillus cereus Rock3-28]
MAVAHRRAGAGMASDDGELQRDRKAPETLVLQRCERGGPFRCPGTAPEEAVIRGDGWARRRAANSSPASTGAETPPARVRRFRRGAAPTPRLQCAQDALGAVWNANDTNRHSESQTCTTCIFAATARDRSGEPSRHHRGFIWALALPC